MESNTGQSINVGNLNPTVKAVTDRIVARSQKSRQAYLARMQAAKQQKPPRSQMPCGNFAHGMAACTNDEKTILRSTQQPNIAIVTAYNDMLSAHQPYHRYPQVIKQHIEELGGVAQVAGGTPAMCDGVTQGLPGMELSLFSRDVIALSVGVALSHNLFDGVFLLGICDKIVPGLLIGALSFGYLPIRFIPAGPMPSGLPNKEKAKIRQQFATGEVDRETLLNAESESYHSPGTCTFYGTANTNQMMVEIMGLQLPSASFVNPNTPLREALTKQACVEMYSQISEQKAHGLADIIAEKTVVNGIVGLLATGGSTNHTLHMLAIARAAGIQVDWQDMADLSKVVPLLVRAYPNGEADINHFHSAGGMGLLIRELLQAGYLHNDVNTCVGEGLQSYCQEAFLDNDNLTWKAAITESLDTRVVRPVAEPFQAHGGLTLLHGNIGKAVIKTSAVAPEHLQVTAKAKVFYSQEAVAEAFRNGELNRDVMVVLPGQGPRANGMPELHRLTPMLGVLQDKGFKVALITDGRMSGASGKVPAAIHVAPEALAGGAIAKIQDGDEISLDGETGQLTLHVDEQALAKRQANIPDVSDYATLCGRELFAPFRQMVGRADEGASIFGQFLLAEEVTNDAD